MDNFVSTVVEDDAKKSERDGLYALNERKIFLHCLFLTMVLLFIVLRF